MDDPINATSLKKDIVFLYAVQGVSMLTSIVMSLVVPKTLSVEEFAYWQVFLLYSSYVSVTMLGIHDGIYLIEGGKTRKEVDRSDIGSQLVYAYVFQILLGLAVVVFGALFSSDERRFIFVFVGIYLVFFNIQGSLGVLFQALNEVRVYSKGVLILRSTFLLFLAGLLIAQSRNSALYIGCYVTSEMLACVYALYKARDFFECRPIPIKRAFASMRRSVSVGLKLMISSIASMLILGVSKFAVEGNWSLAVFGEFSFAMSLTVFFCTFMIQAAMVFFPALRKSSKSVTRTFFMKSRRILSLVLSGLYLLYFPIVLFIEAWLPQYGESLWYLGILLPICVFDGKMEICCSTLLKVFRKEKLLLGINIAAVALACLGAVAGLALGSLETILLSSVVTVILRSVVSEMIIAAMLHVRIVSLDTLLDCLIAIVFVGVVTCVSFERAAMIMMGVYLIIVGRYAFKTLGRSSVDGSEVG
ncbi:hypothetical protein ABG957_09300 [Eggerthella lenta]|uniref:lipopolysaccharide biosynthesis protein n=1 Tax=Eggerthella lenta TaxID=84112 RepID=UPI001897504D|nr:hypothetical protein [Eggerthella lenta]MDB1807037.1 hypothetical protein [Eggerthella lenta]